MKKIFVHVGGHKTGSTSLQYFLAINSERFRLIEDIYIPRAGRIPAEAVLHANIAWELTNDRRYNKKYGNFENMISEIKNCNQNVLISAEDFEYLVRLPDQLEFFEKKIKEINYEIIYIYFFRNNSTHALSLYYQLMTQDDQTIKLENIFNFFRKIFFHGFYLIPNSNYVYYFNYKKFIDKFKKISKGTILPIDYNANKNNIFNCFLKQLNITQIQDFRYPSEMKNTTNYKKNFKYFLLFFLSKLIYIKFKIK